MLASESLAVWIVVTGAAGGADIAVGGKGSHNYYACAPATLLGTKQC